MNFGSIIGQQEIISSLVNSIMQGRIGHAYMFSGPAGIGKKTVAGIFSKVLLCEKQGCAKSCGECMPCRLMAEGSNPDYYETGGTGTSIGVDEIRKIQSDIIIKPLYSKRKVYLIADADRMTVQAQNCLLKTLEEPPGYAVIILTVSNTEALLETVRSRVIKYGFKKNSYREIRSLLEQKLGNNDKGIDFIASYSDGIIGMALKLAESEEFSAIREKTLEIILRMSKSNMADVYELYGFFDSNRDNINTILDIMVLYYRDMLVLKESGNERILINLDKKDIILSKVSAFTTVKLIKNIETIEMTRNNIKNNVNYQLSIEVMLMKLQEELS